MLAKPELNEFEVLALLRGRLAAAGSQRALADELGVSLSYVHDALTARRSLGPALLSALGLKREVTYRKIKSVEAA